MVDIKFVLSYLFINDVTADYYYYFYETENVYLRFVLVCGYAVTYLTFPSAKVINLLTIYRSVEAAISRRAAGYLHLVLSGVQNSINTITLKRVVK